LSVLSKGTGPIDPTWGAAGVWRESLAAAGCAFSSIGVSAWASLCRRAAARKNRRWVEINDGFYSHQLGLSSTARKRAGEGEGEMMDGNIFNSRGAHVAIVRGPTIFDLKGKKLYDLRGINIYKLSGELVGHLANARAADKHLDKATDKLFSSD
jgi:hypothetical protein